MSIRIIKDDERLTREIEGAVFTYRRIPAHKRSKIVDDYTSKRSGNVNWGKASMAILQYSLLDWDKVEDENGKAIPFDKALITYLHDAAQAELMECLGENAESEETDPKEADIKNSETSQLSNT